MVELVPKDPEPPIEAVAQLSAEAVGRSYHANVADLVGNHMGKDEDLRQQALACTRWERQHQAPNFGVKRRGSPCGASQERQLGRPQAEHGRISQSHGPGEAG